MPKKGKEALPGFWPQPLMGKGAMAMAPVLRMRVGACVGVREEAR